MIDPVICFLSSYVTAITIETNSRIFRHCHNRWPIKLWFIQHGSWDSEIQRSTRFDGSRAYRGIYDNQRLGHRVQNWHAWINSASTPDRRCNWNLIDTVAVALRRQVLDRRVAASHLAFSCIDELSMTIRSNVGTRIFHNCLSHVIEPSIWEKGFLGPPPNIDHLGSLSFVYEEPYPGFVLSLGHHCITIRDRSSFLLMARDTIWIVVILKKSKFVSFACAHRHLQEDDQLDVLCTRILAICPEPATSKMWKKTLFFRQQVLCFNRSLCCKSPERVHCDPASSLAFFQSR